MHAAIDFDGGRATMTTDIITLNYTNAELMVSPRIASSERFISFPNGGQFVCADQTYLDRLPQESPSEGIVALLENRLKVAIACVVIIVLTLSSGYFLGLPAMAEYLSNRFPMDKEQKLGEDVLSYFDGNGWLMPSVRVSNSLEEIEEGFDKLCAGLPLEDYYQLNFRSSKIFGANAFALPGGIIVVSDDLIDISESDEEVLAILAHEIGHVELRHTIRSIMQDSIIAATVAVITSDAATLSVAVAGLPAVLAQRKYSRKFETDADTFAFELLRRKGYSPAAFAAIMERLTMKRGEGSSTFNYFRTHPVTEERLNRAYLYDTQNR